MVKFPESVNNFRVDFIFQQNEFFTPEILSKTYEYDKDAVLKKVIGTEVSKEKTLLLKKLKKKLKKGKNFFMKQKKKKLILFSLSLIKLTI